MKRHLTISAIAALLSFAAAVLAWGAGPDLDKRVSLSLEKAGVAEAFRALGQMSGLNVLVDPKLSGTVTIRLENVRLRTTLDAVCDSIGCRWEVSGDHLRIQPTAPPKTPPPAALDQPIDLKVTKADLREILNTAGEILSAQVVIDPALTTTAITLELNNTPVRKALDEVCRIGNCAWSLNDEDGKKVLRFSPRK